MSSGQLFKKTEFSCTACCSCGGPDVVDAAVAIIVVGDIVVGVVVGDIVVAVDVFYSS